MPNAVLDLKPGPLIAATHNRGKLAELEAMFSPLGFEILSAKSLGLAEPEETEFSFAGNALLKAHAAARAGGLPALSDDSGICVAALGGMPGVFTADWAGSPRDFYHAMEKVEAQLQAIGTEDRRAKFVCVLAIAWPDGREAVFEGEVQGTLVWPPRGTLGFGFDPVSVPLNYAQTFGEMQPDFKHSISHRAAAFAKLSAALL